MELGIGFIVGTIVGLLIGALLTLLVTWTKGKMERERRLWSSPRKMETRLRVFRVVRPLELRRGQIPQGGVPADAVVEHLDVLEDARPAPRSRVAYVSSWTSSFFRLAKKLSTGALSQHCATPLMLHAIPCSRQQPLVVLAGVLAAPVRVRQQPLAREPAARPPSPGHRPPAGWSSSRPSTSRRSSG